MTLEASMPAPSSPERRLAKDSVGLAHIVFFVVAAAAPLTAVVGASPAAFAFGNGAGVPGAFMLAGLLYLLFSVGFTAMSRHVGGAGAFYTYITHGIGKPVGVGGAFMALVTYSAVQIAIYGLFGFFMANAIAPLGLVLPWWVWAFAALVVVLVCGQRNIAFSGAILGVCMIAEIGILLILDLAIVFSGGGPEGIAFSSFAPSQVFTPGLGVALVFVIGSFIGFEATAIFGEEAEDPEKTIPRATYVAVLLITLFYAFSTWAIVQFYGPGNVQASAAAGLDSFYFAAANSVLGAWSSQVMNVLLITSCLPASCPSIIRSTAISSPSAGKLGRQGAWQGSRQAWLTLRRGTAAKSDRGHRPCPFRDHRSRSIHRGVFVDGSACRDRYSAGAGAGLRRDRHVLPQDAERLQRLDHDDRPDAGAARSHRFAGAGQFQSFPAFRQ